MPVNFSKFSVMYEELEMAEVHVVGGNFEVVALTSHFKNPIVRNNNRVFDFLQEQVFDEHNIDKSIILKDLGLNKYDVWEIVKLTNAFSIRNHYWIRFKGQGNLTWNKVRRLMLTKGSVADVS